MNHLAVSYFAAGRKDDALKMSEEVLALYRKVNGPEHPETLVAMFTLTFSYSAAGRKGEALKMSEEVLALYRKVNGPEHPDTLLAMTNLAFSYSDAGRWDEALPLLTESSTKNPENTSMAMQVAVLQVWFGKDTEHTATSERMLAWAKDVTKPDDIERSAKLACLRPIADAALREAALARARKAVELGKGNPGMPYYKMTLGMTEYRDGRFAEAVQTLLATPDTTGIVGGTSAFYRAMSLFQQGKKDEARALFTATAATMKALPADEKQPLAGQANADDLILWLAYKEAKALLAQPGPPAK
jgi:tetratricopeptide (TPR) repeat protein